MNTPKAHVPKELDHLQMIVAINKYNRNESESLFNARSDNLRCLGTAMCAIYEAATCNRKCLGGDHVLEGIAARTYNLACSAYSLISIGFYDEALNLIRSIGEISNLLVLSATDKALWNEWKSSDKNTRIRKFTPAKVRKMLGEETPPLMDADWYSDLCESYTHLTPGADVNMHNEDQRRIAGGLIQEQGFEKALGQLEFLVSIVSLYFCKNFDLDDLFNEITKWAGETNGDEKDS